MTKHLIPRYLFLVLFTLFLSGLLAETAHSKITKKPIQPYAKNPYYWQYDSKPVLLIGGSKDDNLFQIPNLKPYLDELQAAGINYIRNTMSDSKDKGRGDGFEVYPYKKLPHGKYDLNQWNDEYWKRFANMLQWTYERDIIVQIEVWDRFDYSRTQWTPHPYNPKNNINYNQSNSTLKATYNRHPGSNEQPFFYTVPKLKNNKTLLPYQQKKIDKMLSYSLRYPHVLYCMDNETGGSPEWGKYWANYIRKKAKAAGTTVQLTEMWDAWDLNAKQHRATFDHPETYSFIDISQNNQKKGQPHWDNAQHQRNRIAKQPRPMNCVKIYGADTGRFGSTHDALERFWRNVLGGTASSRFHRPDAGIGSSNLAKAHIKSVRMLTDAMDIFRCTPDSKYKMLTDRKNNEAYLTFIQGEKYAIYFPSGGSVGLNLTNIKGSFQVEWLNIAKSKWVNPKVTKANQIIKLTAPDKGHWVVMLTLIDLNLR